ncbi:MAG TPA: hypothetical protein VGL51_16085 [Solirubrobacteraceae bacterium]|jgi:uncharacterized protein YukE
MINGGGSTVATGGSVFPEPPKGSPGEISGCSRTLSNAADDLERADGGLRGASSSLEADWQGYAAAAYHSSSEALASVARGGAETFRESAHAVSGYATALDHAQSEIRRLRTLYDEAKHRQAAAANLAGRLVGSLASATKPAEVTRLQSQVTTAEGQSQDAGSEADGYAQRANTVLAEFKQSASRYEQVLNGERPGRGGGPLGSPFSGAGSAGPGFGAPFNSFALPGNGSFVPGGLSAYSGVIPVGDDPYNSPIPGFGIYWDGRHENLTSPDDLTNLILLIAPVAGIPARELGGAALRQLGIKLGIGAGGRAAVDDAGQKALQTTLDRALGSGEAHHQPFSQIVRRSIEAGRMGSATERVAQSQARARLLDAAVKVVDKIHSLPPGLQEGLAEIAHRGSFYLSYGATQLGRLQASLLKSGTPAAQAAARVIGRILSLLGR